MSHLLDPIDDVAWSPARRHSVHFFYLLRTAVTVKGTDGIIITFWRSFWQHLVRATRLLRRYQLPLAPESCVHGTRRPALGLETRLEACVRTAASCASAILFYFFFTLRALVRRLCARHLSLADGHCARSPLQRIVTPIHNVPAKRTRNMPREGRCTTRRYRFSR